jgi:hypothetical protein
MGEDESDHGETECRTPESDPSYDDSPDPEWEEEGSAGTFIRWPRDPQLDPAKADLVEWFDEHPTAVFYGRQIEVIFEKKYFHWITHKALRELTRDGVVATELRITPGRNKLRLYWSKRNRYAKRASAAMVKHVEQHSDPELTRAIGQYAESLFGIAAGREGFKLHGPSIRVFKGGVGTKRSMIWIGFLNAMGSRGVSK